MLVESMDYPSNSFFNRKCMQTQDQDKTFTNKFADTLKGNSAGVAKREKSYDYLDDRKNFLQIDNYSEGQERKGIKVKRSQVINYGVIPGTDAFEKKKEKRMRSFDRDY